MNNQYLILASVLGPVVAGLLAWLSPAKVRGAIIVLSAIGIGAVGLALATQPTDITLTLEGSWPHVATALEAALILTIAVLALRMRAWVILAIVAAQASLVILEHVSHASIAIPAATFRIDSLSKILILITTLIGPIIAIYAIGYMKTHEHHAPASARSTGVFFFILVGFLGAMSGLVMADNLQWLAIFWEATTLCSFLLIGHDQTPEAKTNSRRALLINSFGGLALTAAAVTAALWGHVDGLSQITKSMGGVAGTANIVGMLCLGGFAIAAMTKSAQMPFQSWLLGAMVAPTPVSALLHSATMVNAGVYVLMRLSPAFAGTRMMDIVALAGAFTFAMTSALAIGQSNGKKVLAYSTIANLGLIVMCAGMGTPMAYSAGLMILCFHALSKGLLFLCMGTIEQQIGSRDIEDMGSIMREMPFTTMITLVGMTSMLAPPFGMLIAKWLAIESSVGSLAILLLSVLGSALTVMFWAKWIGRISTVSHHPHYTMEKLHLSTRITMLTLVLGVIVLGLGSMLVYKYCFQPIALNTFPAGDLTMFHTVAAYLAWPFFMFMGVIVLVGLVMMIRINPADIRQPFLCGENIEGSKKTYEFRSAMDKGVFAWLPTFYFRKIFDEAKVTAWANLAAWVILITLFGVMRGF